MLTACSYQGYMKHACAVYVSYGSKVSSWDDANNSSETHCTVHLRILLYHSDKYLHNELF